MLHKPAHLQRMRVAACILSCKYVQVSLCHSLIALFFLAPDLSCESCNTGTIYINFSLANMYF